MSNTEKSVRVPSYARKGQDEALEDTYASNTFWFPYMSLTEPPQSIVFNALHRGTEPTSKAKRKPLQHLRRDRSWGSSSFFEAVKNNCQQFKREEIDLSRYKFPPGYHPT